MPKLLERPESVVALITISFIATAGYISRTARRITSKITQRVELRSESQTYHRRLRSKLKERDFLMSALSSTKTTLNTNKCLIQVQQNRLENSEHILKDLEKQINDLSTTTAKHDQLLKQLTQIKNVLSDMKDVEKDVEKDIEKNKNLTTTYNEKLKHLEYELSRLEDEERFKRDMNTKTRRKLENEEKCKVLELDVQQKLENVVIKRKEIDELCLKIQRWETQLSKCEQQKSPEKDNVEEIEGVIKSLYEKQKELKNVIENKNENQKVMKRRRQTLQQQLQKADQRLEEMHLIVSQLEKQNSGTEPQVQNHQHNLQTKTKAKLSPGRPLKTDTCGVQQQQQTAKPKRGRGRPRKTIEGKEEETPKRKRGRPRKNSVPQTTSV